MHQKEKQCFLISARRFGKTSPSFLVVTAQLGGSLHSHSIGPSDRPTRLGAGAPGFSVSCCFYSPAPCLSANPPFPLCLGFPACNIRLRLLLGILQGLVELQQRKGQQLEQIAGKGTGTKLPLAAALKGHFSAYTCLQLGTLQLPEQPQQVSSLRLRLITACDSDPAVSAPYVLAPGIRSLCFSSISGRTPCPELQICTNRQQRSCTFCLTHNLLFPMNFTGLNAFEMSLRQVFLPSFGFHLVGCYDKSLVFH